MNDNLLASPLTRSFKRSAVAPQSSRAVLIRREAEQSSNAATLQLHQSFPQEPLAARSSQAQLVSREALLVEQQARNDAENKILELEREVWHARQQNKQLQKRIKDAEANMLISEGKGEPSQHPEILNLTSRMLDRVGGLMGLSEQQELGEAPGGRKGSDDFDSHAPWWNGGTPTYQTGVGRSQRRRGRQQEEVSEMREKLRRNQLTLRPTEEESPTRGGGKTGVGEARREAEERRGSQLSSQPVQIKRHEGPPDLTFKALLSDDRATPSVPGPRSPPPSAPPLSRSAPPFLDPERPAVSKLGRTMTTAGPAGRMSAQAGHASPARKDWTQTENLGDSPLLPRLNDRLAQARPRRKQQGWEREVNWRKRQEIEENRDRELDERVQGPEQEQEQEIEKGYRERKF
eukprot:182942-Hanusia_phi.AAC.1